MENDITSAKELSAMDLNNIKLDEKHTVLTPKYLEDLIQNKDNDFEGDDKNHIQNP